MLSRIVSLLVLAVAITVILTGSLSAAPKITKVDAFWEDSLAVIRPEVREPFSDEIWKALVSGLPVSLDFEVQMIRIGYVKRKTFEIVIQHDVWGNRFRIIAPIGAMTVLDYPALELYFRENLGLIVGASELPYIGSWLVKVRMSEGRVVRDRNILKSHGVEKELSGLTAWLYKLTQPGIKYGKWTDLVQLPDPIGKGR